MRPLKKNDWLRDLIFLLLLIGLIKSAREVTSPSTKKITQPTTQEIVVHELDQTFLDYLIAAEQQIEIATDMVRHAAAHNGPTQKLDELHEQVQTIRNKYTHNSPALAFLGPIGTAAIVFKEQNLEQELLNIINELGDTVHALAHTLEKELSYKPFETIENALHYNQNMLELLLAHTVHA